LAAIGVSLEQIAEGTKKPLPFSAGRVNSGHEKILLPAVAHRGDYHVGWVQ
jgi:hypothetical protein